MFKYCYFRDGMDKSWKGKILIGIHFDR